MNAIISGMVEPINIHHGNIEVPKMMAERVKYVKELKSPAGNKTDCPNENNCGTSNPPIPMRHSINA
jgi:hypothetical protein